MNYVILRALLNKKSTHSKTEQMDFIFIFVQETNSYLKFTEILPHHWNPHSLGHITFVEVQTFPNLTLSDICI